MDYADKLDMMDDDCNIQGFSIFDQEEPASFQRLTQETSKGVSLVMGTDYANEDDARRDLMARFRVAVDRLAAYERSGLTPKRVAEFGKIDVQQWVSVKDGMPEEHDSFLARYYGTPKWDNAMFRKISSTVLITVRDDQGDKAVVTARTKDGNWSADILRIKPYEVTHWMPLPKPAQESLL